MTRQAGQYLNITRRRARVGLQLAHVFENHKSVPIRLQVLRRASLIHNDTYTLGSGLVRRSTASVVVTTAPSSAAWLEYTQRARQVCTSVRLLYSSTAHAHAYSHSVLQNWTG